MKKEVHYAHQRFLLFIFLLSSTIAIAQLENTNWYFGIQTALNFNDGTSPPTLLTNSAMSTEWSSATISDDLGNLLFYTNGKSIWNASHQIMANGNNILGNTDISQDVVIVPIPGDPDKYYVFHNAGNEMGFTGVSYSIVDMTLNGGLGDVDVNEKNILFQGNPIIRMTTVLNPADGSYWLLLFGASDNPIDSDTLYTYKIDATGVTLTNSTLFTLPLAQSSEPFVYGQMKVSPDAQNLALVYNRNDDDGKDIFNTQNIYLFDFDINTGTASNLNSSMVLSDNLYSYGVAFSPDSNLLYVSGTHKLSDLSAVGRIYQMDYRGMSGSTLLVDDLNPVYGFELGIDQKLYAANATGNIHSIDAPNSFGVSAGFNSNAIDISGNGGREFPQSVSVLSAPPKSVLTAYNTSFANDTITRVEAATDGVVVFGQVGSDNTEGLPGEPSSFVAEYNTNGDLLNSGTLQIPYPINVPIEENTYAYSELADGTSLSGAVNKNYLLSKYDSDNQLVFEVNTTNINETLIEDVISRQSYLLFEATSYEDFAISGSTGRTWTKSATQQFANNGTLFTKTLNLARFDASGVLISVIELLNYKWQRTATEGTVAVSYPEMVVGDNNTLYFTVSSRDEGVFTDAAVFTLNNGETYRKGEWLISYNTRSNTYNKAKLVGQNGSVTPNELIYTQSTLYRKRKTKLFKLDQNLTDVDSLVLSKLEVFDTNVDDGTFIIMGDNTRTLKKVDSNFDEIWSATLGRKFTISAASEAPDGSVYYAATYTEDAKLFTDEGDITVLHNSGNDVFLGRFIPDEPVMKAQLTSSNSVDLLDDELIFESTVGLREDVSLSPNPFSDALDIRIQPGSYTIELYNMSGELVRRKVLESKSEEHIEIPTASLKKGIYSARITKANSKTTLKKIIKI